MLLKSNKGRRLRVALFLRAGSPAFVGLQATVPTKQYITKNAILSTVLHPQLTSWGAPESLGWDEYLGQSLSEQQEGAAKAADTWLMLNGRTSVLLNTQTQCQQYTRKYFCLT